MVIKDFFSIFFGMFKRKKIVRLGFYGPVNAGKTSLANRISKDLNKLLGFETVKFSEIFRPAETGKEQEPAL